jgi:hypothetical protein
MIALIAVAVVGAWIPWPTACALVAGVIFLAVFVIKSIKSTLKENPGAVLADQLYLEHQRMTLAAAKNQPLLCDSPPVPDPEPTLLPPPADEEDE